MFLLKDPNRTRELIDVIQGKEASDFAIVNASILNVYTGELLEDYSVSVKGEWIAYIGEDASKTIGKHTRVLDASGKVIIPGLMDAHCHLADWIYSPSEFLPYAMASGTTTIITEAIEPFLAMGEDGLLDFLASLEDQPVKVFVTLPAGVSTSKKTELMSRKLLKELLSQDAIVGLGESYWQGVLKNLDVHIPAFQETFAHGKRVEGHSAGAKGEKLMAYAATGVSSCHEPITDQEALERLRLGMYVMVREGSIREDLVPISRIVESGADLRRLILVTDGVSPKDLLEKGYMANIVQKAINCGFDPVQAIQMATINPSTYFRLDTFTGGIAPGKQADMLVVPDIRSIEPELVISRGRIIAKEGEAVVCTRKHNFSSKSLNSVHLERELEGSDFSILVDSGGNQAKVRVIEMVTDLVTRELIVSVPVLDGEIRSDKGEDLLKVAAIDRRYSPGKMFVGLIKGFGLKSGAIASSGAWDTSDIIVVGENGRDMANAVNRIHSLQGGAVVSAGGKIVAEVPAPVFGLISEMPVPRLAKQLQEITAAMKNLGCPLKDPLRTLVTLTGAAIPFLRICEQGLVDIKSGKILGLVVY